MSVAEGSCYVECLEDRHSDWTQFSSNTTTTVGLKASNGSSGRFRVGDIIHLQATINDGYQAGDLFWICLPPCLSSIEGGGQVKQFTVDPECESQVHVRLAVTGTSHPLSKAPADQHFLVCLRNMYDETRIGSPGPISVLAEANSPVHEPASHQS